MDTITCPRCFAEIPRRADLQFCPRCGLSNVLRAAEDTSPITLTVDGQAYRVGHRLGVGAFCNLYSCDFQQTGDVAAGIFKIARDSRCNWVVENESHILLRLASADVANQFTPFFPRVAATFSHGGSATESPRLANILAFDRAIKSTDELYTLEEVRAAYPAGVDPRDVAWMWRRLLNVLAFVHSCNVVHAAVLPANICIEPFEHKLVLCEWCFAQLGPALTTIAPATAAIGEHRGWFDRDYVRRPITPALDIALAARCMIQLLGGDPLTSAYPCAIEPAIRRHFQRCTSLADDDTGAAARLLGEFDQLIEAMWGPRKFRQLTMPAKRQ